MKSPQRPINEAQRSSVNNVVQMPVKPGASRKATPPFSSAPGSSGLAAAGSPDDPRMQEALRLAKAFLAIEDVQARGTLVAMAESLANRDWLLGAQRL